MAPRALPWQPAVREGASTLLRHVDTAAARGHAPNRVMLAGKAVISLMHVC